MFEVLSKLDKSGARRLDLTHDPHADLLEELEQWMWIASLLERRIVAASAEHYGRAN